MTLVNVCVSRVKKILNIACNKWRTNSLLKHTYTQVQYKQISLVYCCLFEIVFHSIHLTSQSYTRAHAHKSTQSNTWMKFLESHWCSCSCLSMCCIQYSILECAVFHEKFGSNERQKKSHNNTNYRFYYSV